MAKHTKRLAENQPGDYFVDSSCVNCGLSRHYAPSVFGDTGTYAFVKKQPDGRDEILATQRALLSCPTASIGSTSKVKLDDARRTLPLQLAPGIFLTGYASRKSYGAHSYFVCSPGGNWLIDSPRYSRHVTDHIEAAGGLTTIFLSHRDDVADADKYARHFGARRIIHNLEKAAQPDAETILYGAGDWHIADTSILFVPGHTEGHLALLWNEQYLFTGDHLGWITGLDRLGAYPDYCWYSWKKQIASVARLSDLNKVRWVFPGHGKWHHFRASEFSQTIKSTVQWMQTQAM